MIGLDGATWDVVMPLADRGELPNIKKLMDEGAYGNLSPYIPTSSPLIWTTMATGKTPEEHGIEGFLYKPADSYEMRVLASSQRKVKALWNILSEMNKNVAFVGWWATWPAEKVNGVMVSDMMDFKDMKDRVYPPELTDTLDKMLIPTDIGSLERFLGRPIGKDDLASLDKVDHPAAHSLNILARYFARDRSMADIALDLLGHGDYDLFSVYLQGIDPVQHYFWRYAYPDTPADKKGGVEGIDRVIDGYYKFYDELVGELCRAAGKDVVVMLVSDHGMKKIGPDVDNSCPIKDMIMEEGGEYLIRTPDVNAVLARLGFFQYNKDGKPDWKNTRAYSWSVNEYSWERMISINLKGREPQGVVEGERKNAVVNDLIRELRKVRSVNGGVPLFSEVSAASADNYDIACRMNDEVDPTSGFIVGGKTYRYSEISAAPTNLSAAHCDAPDGIVIISGPGIKHGYWMQGASVYDIAPTVLYAEGLAVAKDMQGRVLGDVFERGSLDGRPVSYVDTYETGEAGEARPESTAADQEVKDRLKSLGYVQ